MIDHRSKSYVEVKLSQWEKEVARRFKQESPEVRPKEKEDRREKDRQNSYHQWFSDGAD